MLKHLQNNKIGPFGRNVVTLMSGTIIAQGISFISLIIMQRWFFTPEDFGVLSIFLSSSSVLIALSTLKYEYAIVICDDIKIAISLSFLSLLSVAIVAVLTFSATIWIIPVYNKIQLSYIDLFRWALPAIVLFSGSYEVLSYWCNRHLLYKKISISRVTLSLVTEIFRIGFVPLRGGGKSLVVARVLGQLFASAYLFSFFYREIRKYRYFPSWQELKFAGKLYKDFPLFTMPTILINNLANWLLVYLFFRFYGGSAVGLVSISIQYIAIPFGIFSGAFSQVFLKRLSDIGDREILLMVYIKFVKRLALIGLLAVVIVYSIPDFLIISLLGPKWQGITNFIRMTVIWQAVAFVPSSLSFIYTRLNKQKIMTLFAVSQLLVVYLTLLFGNMYYTNAYETFKVYIFGQAIYYAITTFVAIKFIRSSELLK